MNQFSRDTRKPRSNRVFRLAPTTRAIRAGLAVSATLLALSGSGIAFAGTCAVTGLSEVTCNGVFTDDVTNTVPVINVVPDLTLVVGTDGTTTVDPAFGVSGISSTWGGDATVITYAEISTNGADGVYMYSDETATFVNEGNIETYASTFGDNAVDVSAFGDVSVDNEGFLDAYSYSYDVTALSANSATGSVSVENGADAAVFAFSRFGSLGVGAYGLDSASVDNAGSIGAFGYSQTIGVSAVSPGDAQVDNSGSIAATSVYGNAYGVSVYSWDGATSFYNSADGSVDAHSYYASAFGVQVQGEEASAINDGSITADGNFYGIGITVGGYSGDATLDNSGYIGAVGYLATGAQVATYLGEATLTNSGDIAAFGGSTANGVFINAVNGTATLDNTGSISAEANFGVQGAQVLGYQAVVNNSGQISASSEYGTANGVRAFGYGVYSSIDVVNSGSVDSYSYYGRANGIYVRDNFYGAEISVDNSGTVVAESIYANAFAISAVSSYADIDIVNSGDLLAYGGTFAHGINAFTFYGADISITNSGYIYVSGGSATGDGIVAQAQSDGEIYVLNEGEIVATSDTWAIGLNLSTYDGDVTAINSGDITAEGDLHFGLGIRARSTGAGDATIDNSGNVTASSNGTGAFGLYGGAFGTGSVDVSNSGSVAVYGTTYGLGISTFTYGGDITIDNSGSVYAEAVGRAAGIEVGFYSGYGDASIYNSGSVEVQSLYGDAIGVHTVDMAAGDFYLYNDGAITVGSVYGGAYGVDAEVSGAYATATVVNVGSIDAASVYANALGIHLDATGTYGGVIVDNAGSVSADAYYGQAVGIGAHASGSYGYAEVANSGEVYATSGSDAEGVIVFSGGKYAALDNSGDIYAVASNSGGAYSIAFAIGAGVTSFYGEANLVNSGSIQALAESGYAVANGALASIYGGNSSVTNSGDIGAAAYGEYYATALGVVAESNLLSASVYNSGTVHALAEGGIAAYAVGVRATASESALVYTYADSSIEASATGYYEADAIGAHATGLFASIYGEGAISAEAIADAVYGDAHAYGAYAYGSFTGIYVLGDGSISASAEGAFALAVGALQNGYFTAFHNEGSIEATATGEAGFAIGAMTLSYYGVDMYNSGDISATGNGDGVEARGLFALSLYGDIYVYNSGSISANADYFAVGVQLESDYYTSIYNTGDIEASGAGINLAIYSVGLSADSIYNYGTITGAIWTGEGNDYLYNYGEWNPGQTPSYFGGGDDTIVNVGTINMEDSVIALGTYSVNGNIFYNYGAITVDGTDNVIDMGGPQALVPSANPYAFYNYGVIDFQDGAADDMLTIVGDFAGDGDINVDVSGLDGTSDILYIDGSVVDGSTNTINVELLDLPESIESIVPMVYVSGDSVAGNFELGDVNWDEDNSFVSLDFSLIADIDASNTDPDVFSLGIEVSGLSDPGTLAASLGSSVQSLMNSQVGTWRQRMGVIDSFNKGGVALWARVFTDKGSFTPEHVASNFGQGGNFDFDQKNSGVEGGIDFAVTDEFSIGLLVSKSQADIHLDDPGTGNADLDADTWGVYGTWISPNGFYLDASYRWMNFDVDLSSVAGGMETSGDAEAFNVEMGYAWTLEGGLKIEPQLQYTRTSVNNFDVLTTTTGMTFEEDGGDSSRGRLGVSIRKGFGEADNGWLWTPYATLSAVREFNGKSAYAINNTFFGETSVEGTSALLELGFTARHQNWAIYGGLNWQDGGAVNSFFGGQLGVRYTFGHAAPAPTPVAPPPAKTCADLDDDGDGVNNCDDKCLGSAAGEAVGADGCPVPPEPVMEPKPFRG